MPEARTLRQRLRLLFREHNNRVTLQDLLRIVPDADERNSVQFYLALAWALGNLDNGSKAYNEVNAYFMAFGDATRYVCHTRVPAAEPADHGRPPPCMHAA
jgi:hypothetical protein